MARFLIVLCALLASCGSTPQTLDVIADRATYDAVAPGWLRYVDADPALTEEQKQTRRDTVATWDLRIRKREAALSGGAK
jgi:hypothetical protein